MKDIKVKLEDKVECILAAHETARGSDPELIMLVMWRFYHVKPSTPIAEVMKMVAEGVLPTFEGITRCRRKIQEQGKYRGSRKQVRMSLKEDVSGQMRGW